MTIAIAWVRRRNSTQELIVASDSRLRSRGALDQTQKIFRLDRGDCCLAFCGDAQIAYPLFIQVGTTLNNFIKTRTRALDVTQLSSFVGQILNNLVESWDLAVREKSAELQNTRILFAGWSWENKRFDIGYFAPKGCSFVFHHQTVRMPHPWHEKKRSLVFIGDYEPAYMDELKLVLQNRYPADRDQNEKIDIDFDYEPIEALQCLLAKGDPNGSRTAIGGSPQLVKIYPYGNSLPFVVRIDADTHYLLGRRLFTWEKTEYPVIDLSKGPPVVLYPMASIPVPGSLPVDETSDEKTEGESLVPSVDDRAANT